MNEKNKSKKVATFGILFALSITLSYIEALFPLFPIFPPGFKLGFSNIVTMYTLYFVGFVPALALAVLKSMFQLLLRGVVAGTLSFVGGIMSVAVMGLFIYRLKKYSFSIMFVSIFGAVSHNLGQLVASAFIIKTYTVMYYLPVILIFGIIMGFLMGVVLSSTLKVLKNIKNN